MRHPFYFDGFHHELEAKLSDFISKASDLWGDSNRDVVGLTKASVRAMGAHGLLRYVVPRAYGGVLEGIDSRCLALIRERLAYHSGVVDSAFAMQGLGAYPILLGGNEEQKERWLCPIADGSRIAGFAITEPEAGSDAAHLRASASRTSEGGYRLSGVKHLISNAGIADYYSFFARTGPEKGHRGISAFIVEERLEGVDVSPQALMADHVIGRLELREVDLPADRRIGGEGEGFKLAMRTLNRYRPTVGAAAIGMASRALDEAVRYASTRRQFGRKLIEQQVIRTTLAELATELEAARLLVYQAAWIADHREDPRGAGLGEGIKEAAMAKLHATETAWKVIDAALQLHGGIGLVQGMKVESLYREIRPLRIYEGTSEIQKLVIASEVLKSVESA